MINVVFCADLGVIVPLQVAVASLISRTPRDLTIYLGRDSEQSSLIPWVSPIFEAAKEDRTNVKICDLSLNVAQFKSLKSLHGNWMTYARLALPDALSEVDRIIYLDADIIVKGDLGDLWNIEIGENILAGVPHTTLEFAKEQEVWRRFSMNLNSPYFNAGVLLMDLKKMRDCAILGKCWEYFSKVEDCYTVVDQTALIVACHGRWLVLDEVWNFAAWPGDPIVNAQDAKIIHYVGSPKPWDIFASLISPLGIFWIREKEMYSDEIERQSCYIRFISGFTRLWSIKGSYFRAIVKFIRFRF